jgi:magnesium-protoporphyrin IX monomethyl ester (oxidative) cyclase
MPFAPLERPSIGLGLLKAALSEAKISSRVVYANLQFAEIVGYHSYRWVEGTATEYLLGDWIFSGAAFPEFEPDHEDYLDLILRQWPALVPRQPASNDELVVQKELLHTVRAKAMSFVDKLARSIFESGPTVVGCSSTFLQSCASLALLRRIREFNPDTVTLMGGANCEGEMGLEIRRAFPWIDLVVSGEGDEIIAELCQVLLANGRLCDSRGYPPGVIATGDDSSDTRRRARHTFRNSVQNLDHLPSPNYDEYFAELEASTIRQYIKPGLLLEASRGCWWGQRSQCTFCGLNGLEMEYRDKSASRVRQEISDLTQRYELKRFGLVDNVLSTTHVQNLLPMLEGDAYSGFCEVRSNLGREDIRTLAAAGFRSIQPGVESLHDSALKLMRKGTSALKNIEVLKWASEFGVRAYWNIICGLPGEDDRWYTALSAWLPAIYHLQPPMTIVSVRFDRFSVYHQAAEAYGLKLVPYRTYRFVYPLAEESLDRFAYFFEDANDTSNFNIWSLHKPGQQTLRQQVNRWKAVFNGEPPPILCRHDQGQGAAIEITDTRPCATDSQFVLRGLAARVYRLCEVVRPVESLQRELYSQVGSSPSSSEVESVVEELKGRQVVLQQNGKLLGLAVPQPMAPMPPLWEFPFGFAMPPDFEEAKKESFGSPGLCLRSSPTQGAGIERTDQSCTAGVF